MNTEIINAPSSNITLPLNQSVQQTNGAQFALMLSLLYESRVDQPAASAGAQTGTSTISEKAAMPVAPQFNLETSQTRALFSNQQAHFQLMHSLYAERAMTVDVISAGGINGVENVLQEINQGNENQRVTQEAERVRFSNTTKPFN